MITWAYVAGFLDGEGNVDPRSRQVTLFQKDSRVLVAIQEFLAFQGIKATLWQRKPRTHNNLGYLDYQHQLNVTDKVHVERFLSHVRPYVIVKKQPVEDVWRYLRMYPRLPNTVTGGLSRITDKHVSRIRKGKPWPEHGNQHGVRRLT